ncbi:MAG: glycosyltransferase family 39 protein [Anaerolineales bacterium]
MKRTYLVFFTITVLLEGFTAIFMLWQMQFDAGRGQIVNYAVLRVILTALSGIVLAVLFGLLIVFFRGDNFVPTIFAFLDGRLVGLKMRLFFIQGTLTLLTIFLAECFLLTYLAIPVPMRPVLVWATLTTFQIWLVLRLAYASEYRKRPSLAARLREKWQGWLPVQRKTLIVLAVMGLVYFVGFMPTNFMLDSNGHFYTHSDEAVIYPDVAKVLVWKGTISDVVHLVIEQWPWWYGYPYLPMSAAVLLVPRLVLGIDYASNIQLNVFLLRQFISILPMLLSIMLLVYMANRYKSLWQSVAIFVFLALVPGVVKFNYQFWHPDSIIVLLILLTFYFLEKDRLRFGKYFYFAAVTCGLTVSIKLWGLFFVLAIGGYLLAGLLRKQLTFKQAVLSGLAFILAMVGTVIITSPGLIAPYITRVALESWTQQQGAILHGYVEPDPTNVYGVGLANWLRFFGFYFMKPFFFFFAVISLLISSLWGSRKVLSRLILAWSVAVAFFLVNFAAMKNFQYMLPLMMPLYLGAILFPLPAVTDTNSKTPAFLKKPLMQQILWGIPLLLFSIQFIINCIIVIRSPMMGY